MLPAVSNRRNMRHKFISKFAYHKDAKIVLKEENSLINLVFEQPAKSPTSLFTL